MLDGSGNSHFCIIADFNVNAFQVLVLGVKLMPLSNKEYLLERQFLFFVC